MHLQKRYRIFRCDRETSRIPARTQERLSNKSRKQFKKAVLVYGQQRLWPIASTTQDGGNIRGYTGIALQRPKREPAVEFGGRIMAERVQHYMSLNPKPAPPIEVSSYAYYQLTHVIFLEI